MQKIKLRFIDFWPGFDPRDNYFFKLLSAQYVIDMESDPDLIIFSCYGNDHLNYDCIRIFYSAENMRPNFSGADYAITFDFNKDARHFRLPLYALYIDREGSVDDLTKKLTEEEARAIWRSKSKFCCMVVSNDSAKKRLEFFKKLSAYLPVDSGGRTMNNVGGPVENKMEFIKDYRFVIGFENSSYPGYTTEKIVEPMLTNSIPLYWGNPLIGKDFNPSAFINLHDYQSDDEMISRIAEINNDEDAAVKILMQPKFPGNIIPEDIDKQRLSAFLSNIITLSPSQKPVAKSGQRFLYRGYIMYKKMRQNAEGIFLKAKTKLSKIKQ